MRTSEEELLAPVDVRLCRADMLILGSALDGLADRLLGESAENRPLAQALWNLDAAIEKVDVDAFRPDYRECLDRALRLYAGYFEMTVPVTSDDRESEVGP